MRIISYFIIFVLLANQITYAQNDPEYLVGPNDILQVSFWEHPELSGTAVVLPDGTISYPVIGDVYVKGKTLKDIAKEITKKFNAYYKSPVISVTLSQFQNVKEQIVILGEVRFPDTYDYKEGNTLIEYIAEAGGFTESSKQKGVIIIRQTPNETKKFKINVEKILKEGNVDENITIVPGDKIYVPRYSRYLPRSWEDWAHFAGIISTSFVIYFYIRDLRK